MSTLPPSYGNPPSGADHPDPLAALSADLDRRERAARRGEIPVIAGLALFGAALAVGGAPSRFLILLGCWIAGLGALLLAGRVARDREEAGAGPRGAITVDTFRGEPATVLREHPARATLTAVATAYPGLLFLALAVLGAVSGQHAGFLAVLAVVGAAFLVAAARQVLRARRAGVWLTPAAVVVVRRDAQHRIAWIDVVAVSEPRGPVDLVVLRARSSAAVEASGRVRPSLGLPEEVSITTGATAVDAPALARVLRHYTGAGTTAELGTPASVTTVRGLARS